MRINLDSDACQGHNRCYMLAPELFDTDDEGYAVLRIDGDLPEELQDKAMLSVDNCPEFAIDVAGE